MAPHEIALPQARPPLGEAAGNLSSHLLSWLKECDSYPEGPSYAGGAGRPRAGVVQDAHGRAADDALLASCLARAQAGDLQAFGELSAHIGPRLVRYVLGFLNGDLHAANDAVQETLIAAWRGRQGFEDTDHLKAWLYRVARYQSVNWIRRRGPGGEPLRALPDDERTRLPHAGARARAATTSESDSDPLLCALRRAMHGLPPRHIAPLRLHYLMGHDTRETARLLGISQTALKMRLHRARNALRKCLVEQADANGDASLRARARQFATGAAARRPSRPAELPPRTSTEGDLHA